MNLKSIFVNAEHSFVGFAEKEYMKLYNAAPKVEHIADVAFKYCLPAISLIVSAEFGAPAGAVVASVGAEAQKDLIAASGLLYDFGPNPSAGNMISGVSSNLAGLLADGHITNKDSVAKVTGVINNLSLLSTAISNTVAAASAPAQMTLGATDAPVTAQGVSAEKL